jgi:hypothetical protein
LRGLELEISPKRTNILKAENASGVVFEQRPFSYEEGGFTRGGVEFFPKNNIFVNPPISLSNLELFEEHGRLKGTMIVHFHEPQLIIKCFHPAANIMKVFFDDPKNSEGFAFIEIHNLDLIDLGEPYKIKGLLSANMRFVMKGYQESNKFFNLTPEMVNWFDIFGVKVWAYTSQQKKIENY